MLVATLGGGTRMRQMRKVRLIKTALLEVTQLALMLTHQGWAWGPRLLQTRLLLEH